MAIARDMADFHHLNKKTPDKSHSQPVYQIQGDRYIVDDIADGANSQPQVPSIGAEVAPQEPVVPGSEKEGRSYCGPRRRHSHHRNEPYRHSNRQRHLYQPPVQYFPSQDARSYDPRSVNAIQPDLHQEVSEAFNPHQYTDDPDVMPYECDFPPSDDVHLNW